MEAALKSHTCAVIDEYLAVARLCVDVDRGGGAVWGYPAALLLFSATDAIGRGILPAIGGNDARLDVLATAPFNLALDTGQINLLRHAYRNTLSHNGQLGRGAVLTADRVGAPFEFQSGGVVSVRVPVFFDLLERGWTACRGEFTPPDGDRRQGPAIPIGIIQLDPASASATSTRSIIQTFSVPKP